jgi:hypothetical protein
MCTEGEGYMSDQLVVEFHENYPSSEPVVAVLSLHGGDSPDSAAETLADFFLQVGSLRNPEWHDAGALAARFIVMQHTLRSNSFELGNLAASPIAHKTSYGRQLVRIYGREKGPLVQFVRDSYTKLEELAVARYILENCSIEVMDAA